MTQFTGGTVKFTIPSNYQTERCGAEVTIHYQVEEGASWETQCQLLDLAGERAKAKARGLVGIAPSATDTSEAPAPVTTAEPKNTRAARGARKDPAEVVIPATTQSSSPAVPSTDVAEVGIPTPPIASATDVPTTTEVPTTGGASIAPPLVPELPADASAPALPSTPASTGTEVPVPGQVTDQYPSELGPTVPVPEVAASPSGVEVPAAAGGELSAEQQALLASLNSPAEISDKVLQEASMQHAARLMQVPGKVQGQPVVQVRETVAKFAVGPGGMFSIPQEQRQAFLDALAALT